MDMIKMMLPKVVVAVFVLTVLNACFHDEEDNNVNVNVLDGHWFGYEENFNSNTRNRVGMVIENGAITMVEREDQGLVAMVDQNKVGNINVTTNTVFAYEFSDASKVLGNFLTNDAHTHMTFVDEQFNFGVLEKVTDIEYTAMSDLAAAVSPAFALNDVADTWLGFSVAIRNAQLTVANELIASLTVELDTLNYVGRDTGNSLTGGEFIGTVSLQDVDRGIYKHNNWTNPVDVDKFGDLTLILSPDKSYLAGRVCIPVVGVADIEACTFMSLN